MFYNIEKLNELEKELSENLMHADGKTHEKAYNEARKYVCLGACGVADELSSDCDPLYP